MSRDRVAQQRSRNPNLLREIDGGRQRRLPRRPRLPKPPAGALSDWVAAALGAVQMASVEQVCFRHAKRPATTKILMGRMAGSATDPDRYQQSKIG